MKKIGKLELTRVKVKELKQHPLNPNQGDVGAIVESLEAHGYFRPVLVQASTMHIIAGNHTVQACQIEGLDEIDVILHDVDDDQALRIMLADNETANKAQNDPASLTDLLESLVRTEYGLAGTGFTGEDLDELIAEFKPEPVAEVKEPDEIEPPLDPVTKPGDVWLLGPHRLICGDATDPEVIKQVLNGKSAELFITDPPYGVSYADKNEFLNSIDKGNRIQTPIKNDHLTPDEVAYLWQKTWQSVLPSLGEGACYYVTGPQGGDLLLLLLRSLADNGFPLRHMLIWAKNNFVLGRSDYNYQHEPIIYGWVKGSHKFYGENNETSVWNIDKPHVSKLHPTMKPVELWARAIKNSSVSGDTVLDTFAGSGTIVIACEELRRKAAAVELDPAYCDIICNRFQGVTGIVPILESTREEVSFVD
jgi:DNA modification methylase